MFNAINVPFTIFAIIALNLTIFALALQMDLLIIDSDLSKVIAWSCAVGMWHTTYRFRNR